MHSIDPLRDPPARRTLVLGGARSGKSRHAEAMLTARSGPWLYIATAQAFDDEMRARIAVHRARRDDGWTTREVPLDLAAAISEADHPALVDCLTLWLTNVILAERDVAAEVDGLVAACAGTGQPLVLVANEVGLGIVPENALARRFRDEAGVLNQRIAAVAERVVLVAAGLPLTLKEPA